MPPSSTLFKFTLLLLVFMAPFARVPAQIETGTWLDHPNFSQCVDVAASAELGVVLVAAETAVFTIALDAGGAPTGEIQRFGRAQGLSRADIAAVALAPELRLAIVAYSEGTFDLISIDADGLLSGVFPVSDLSSSNVQGSKQPHRLVVDGESLMLCLEFGVVDYDLGAQEVRDTWRLEFGGIPLSVRSVVRRGDQWWAATSFGLWVAPVDSPFPGNPATWVLSGFAGADLVDLIPVGAEEMAVIERLEGPDAVWRMSSSQEWVNLSMNWEKEWKRLASEDGRLWATTQLGVVQWEPDGTVGTERTTIGEVSLQPTGMAVTAGGVWIANGLFGTLRFDAEGDGVYGPYVPNGPRKNDSYRLDAWNDRLWVASGGVDAGGVPLYRRDGFYGQKGLWWRNIVPPPGEVGSNGVQDPMDVSIHPITPEVAVFGCLEEGLVQIVDWGISSYFNPDNSPLEWNSNWSTNRCSVSALDYDRQGNLWMANEGCEHPLKMLDATGEWHVFELEGLNASTRFLRLLATQGGQVWMALGSGGGVAVMSTEGTPTNASDDDFRILSQGEGQGGLPSPFVTGLEEDLDGEVWVGTLQGPAVFYQPASVFDSDPLDAQQILIEQDGNFQYLLETETVLDIALDGGNRKWLATVNNGVFLLSPDGREQVEHFTAENSPLPSNEVYDVAIDQASGMVYFATPNGISSYRGSATNFVSEMGDSPLTIFPNPLRPEDAPFITIDGLAFGSEVHIVNASGRRVRRVESAGGRAVWDTLDDLGRPVPEGVYFALAGEAANKSGGSGKMVILR